MRRPGGYARCEMVFRYAIATGRAERDPSAYLRDALTTHSVRHRATISIRRKSEPCCELEDFEGQPTTKAALALAPHVFVRPGELRHAEWSEFDFDKAIWAIPAAKMKMRRPHRVPLSRQSLSILDDLKAITSGGRLLFPSVRTLARPISENTLNAALRRLGYASDEMSTHGFRAMAATLLNETGRSRCHRTSACASGGQCDPAIVHTWRRVLGRAGRDHPDMV